MGAPVIAHITTSLDGYVAGPDDGPRAGLGKGGERLHYWVFGGPWSYESEQFGDATGVDAEFLDELMARQGAVVTGRGTFEAAGRWGGSNPWPYPAFVVTHEPPEDVPADAGFTFVDGVGAAVSAAHEAAGPDKGVMVMGGASVIRQAFAEGLVDEFILTIAPFVLGGGKRLFEGFDQGFELEQVRVRQSQWATHLEYRVKH